MDAASMPSPKRSRRALAAAAAAAAEDGEQGERGGDGPAEERGGGLEAGEGARRGEGEEVAQDGLARLGREDLRDEQPPQPPALGARLHGVGRSVGGAGAGAAGSGDSRAALTDRRQRWHASRLALPETSALPPSRAQQDCRRD